MYTVTKSTYYNRSVESWSEKGILHVAEHGKTLCGCRVGGTRKGWIQDGDSVESILQPTNVYADINACQRCAKSYKRAR